MDQINQKQLLGEVEDLIRSGPKSSDRAAADHQWLGQVSALLDKSLQDSSSVDSFLSAMGRTGSLKRREQEASFRRINVSLSKARRVLQWRTGASTGVVIERGMEFDYFDRIRKIIEQANSEIFFVDPYINAEFVSNYMGFIDSSIKTRLLTNSDVNSLVTAIKFLSKQSGVGVEIRSSKGIHDRFIFVDQQNCYMSGASFKDGAKRSPTVIAQITDAFDALFGCYQKIWNSSRKEYPCD